MFGDSKTSLACHAIISALDKKLSELDALRLHAVCLVTDGLSVFTMGTTLGREFVLENDDINKNLMHFLASKHIRKKVDEDRWTFRPINQDPWSDQEAGMVTEEEEGMTPDTQPKDNGPLPVKIKKENDTEAVGRLKSIFEDSMPMECDVKQEPCEDDMMDPVSPSTPPGVMDGPRKVLPMTIDCPVCRRTYNSIGSLQEHLTQHTVAHIQSKSAGDLASKKIPKPHDETILIHPRENIKGSSREVESSEAVSSTRQRKKPKALEDYLLTDPVKEEESKEQLEKDCLAGKLLIECPVCKRLFQTVETLKVHLEGHSGGVYYSCTNCSQVFTSKEALVNHEYEMHPGSRVCKACGQGTMEPMMEDSKYRCDNCSEEVPMLHNIVSELRRDERESCKSQRKVKLKCKTAPKRSAKPGIKVNLRSDGKKTYTCYKCDKLFDSADSVRGHVVICNAISNSVNNYFKCTHCPKQFMTRHKMTHHRNWAHGKNRKFQCDLCMRTFSDKKTLNSHILWLHKGERYYSCHLCDEEFMTQEDLHKHMRDHPTQAQPSQPGDPQGSMPDEHSYAAVSAFLTELTDSGAGPDQADNELNGEGQVQPSACASGQNTVPGTTGVPNLVQENNEDAENAEDESSSDTVVNEKTKEVENYIESFKNKQTQRKTTQHMDAFKIFLMSKSEDREPEHIPPSDLDMYLSMFFINLKKSDGEDYEPSSIISFQSSIERYLKERKYGKSITQDEEFGQSREVIKTKNIELRKKGKGVYAHRKRAPTDEELALMWETGALGTGTPDSLQHTVWWIMATVFGVRTSADNRTLRWGDVTVGVDSGSGLRYLTFIPQVKSTSRKDTPFHPDRKQIKVYEDQENRDMCPVTIFKLFEQKRPPQTNVVGEDFFLQPKYFTVQKSMEKTSLWYKRQTHGINSIKSYMAEVKKKAGLPKSVPISNVCAKKLCIKGQRQFEVVTQVPDPVPEEEEPPEKAPKLEKLCPICARTFRYESDLQRHLISHEKMSYKCDTCAEEFRTTNLLEAHLTVHNPDLIQQCPQCDKTFLTQLNLWHHQDRFHGIQTPLAPKANYIPTPSTSEFSTAMRWQYKKKTSSSTGKRTRKKPSNIDKYVNRPSRLKKLNVSVPSTSVENTDDDQHGIWPGGSQKHKTSNNPHLEDEPDEILEYIGSFQNQDTQRKTKQHSSIFKAYLRENGEYNKPEEMSPDCLDMHLSRFFMTLKKTNGQEYEPATVKSFQTSLDRYFRQKRYGKSICNDIEFFQSQQVVSSKLKELKRKGLGQKPNQKRAPTEEEVEKMWSSGALGTESAESLQHTVWWIMSTRFGVRANRANRALRWGDVRLGMDAATGLEYLAYTQRMEPPQEGTREHVIYEEPENKQRCPISIFKEFEHRRPTQAKQDESYLYLQPILGSRKVGDALLPPHVWYRVCPHGINSIKEYMNAIKIKAGLGKNTPISNISAGKHYNQKSRQADTAHIQVLEAGVLQNLTSCDDQASMEMVLCPATPGTDSYLVPVVLPQ